MNVVFQIFFSMKKGEGIKIISQVLTNICASAKETRQIKTFIIFTLIILSKILLLLMGKPRTTVGGRHVAS